ncbi:unnamed protein product [Ectocarpus sp. 6 AP-2014]
MSMIELATAGESSSCSNPGSLSSWCTPNLPTIGESSSSSSVSLSSGQNSSSGVGSAPPSSTTVFCSSQHASLHLHNSEQRPGPPFFMQTQSLHWPFPFWDEHLHDTMLTPTPAQRVTFGNVRNSIEAPPSHSGFVRYPLPFQSGT